MSRIGDKLNKVPRSRSSLAEQLERQIGYLKRSCDLYDGGIEDEAPRIAVVLRTLLHDTNLSISLLNQLDLKDGLLFVDTALYRDPLDAAMTAWVKLQRLDLEIVACTPGEAGLVVPGIDGSGNPSWIAPLGATAVTSSLSDNPHKEAIQCLVDATGRRD